MKLVSNGNFFFIYRTQTGISADLPTEEATLVFTLKFMKLSGKLLIWQQFGGNTKLNVVALLVVDPP